MDNRLYFVLGDLLANLVLGALVGLLAVVIISTGWNMWLAMVLMMVLGMFISLLGSWGFLYYFGAMEIMIPTMQTGMMSGMVVGMWQAMEPLSKIQGALIGAVTGLIVLNLIWIANTALRGVVFSQETVN